MKRLVYQSSSRKNTKLGVISSGDATVLQRVTSINTEQEESQYVQPGKTTFLSFSEMLELLREKDSHLSESLIQNLMSRGMLNGLQSKSKIVIVGTPSLSNSMAKEFISQSSVPTTDLSTALQEGD